MEIRKDRTKSFYGPQIENNLLSNSKIFYFIGIKTNSFFRNQNFQRILPFSEMEKQHIPWFILLIFYKFVLQMN